MYKNVYDDDLLQNFFYFVAEWKMCAGPGVPCCSTVGHATDCVPDTRGEGVVSPGVTSAGVLS